MRQRFEQGQSVNLVNAIARHRRECLRHRIGIGGRDLLPVDQYRSPVWAQVVAVFLPVIAGVPALDHAMLVEPRCPGSGTLYVDGEISPARVLRPGNQTGSMPRIVREMLNGMSRGLERLLTAAHGRQIHRVKMVPPREVHERVDLFRGWHLFANLIPPLPLPGSRIDLPWAGKLRLLDHVYGMGRDRDPAYFSWHVTVLPAGDDASCRRVPCRPAAARPSWVPAGSPAAGSRPRAGLRSACRGGRGSTYPAAPGRSPAA